MPRHDGNGGRIVISTNDQTGPGPGDAFELRRILEAILFATSEPLSLARLRIILKEHDSSAIQAGLASLAEVCDQEGRAYSLEEIGGGFRFLTRPEYADYLRRLQKVTSSERLTPAALETLAIIAYKQPVIKAEIDAIRGVKSEGTLQSLLRRHLIRVVGRAEVLGRPLLYGTTRLFLDQFGLKNLDELPSPEEVIQRMEEVEQASLVGAQVTRVDLDEGETRDDGLLQEALPETPAFQKDNAAVEDGVCDSIHGDVVGKVDGKVDGEVVGEVAGIVPDTSRPESPESSDTAGAGIESEPRSEEPRSEEVARQRATQSASSMENSRGGKGAPS